MTRKLLADSNRAAIRVISEAEDDWGTTPENGVSRAVRFTSSSIAVSKETALSDEIRSDRMVSSVIETGASSGGDLAFEFSAGNQDQILQSVLQGAWSRPMTFDVWRGSIVSITANNEIEVAGTDITGYLTDGRRIKTSGFVTPGNNRYSTIVSAAFANGVTTITVEGTNLVAESGSAFTVVRDANDVVILDNTDIGIGATARTIDGGGTNPFAALIAASQLVPLQMIYVEGLGYGIGTVTAATVVADNTVTVNDGVNEIVLVAGDSFAVGVDDTETAANIAQAINEARIDDLIYATATSALGVVTITNLNKTGGSIASSDGATLAVVDFAGGDATAGGFFTIVSLTDDTIVVDADLPTIAAGAPVTIKASMLRNPGDDTAITPQSISLETTFTDVNQSFLSDGMRDGTFELDITSGAIITGSVSRQGRETKRQARTLNNAANYTVLDAAATENVSASANVGALRAAGAELSTAVMAVRFTIDGALRAQTGVGDKFPIGITAGRLSLGVTVEAYFADGENYDAFINHDTRDIMVPVIDPEANTYWFTVPSYKITSDPIAPGGIDQDIMETLEGQAFRDSVRECMIQIDRFSSTDPVGA